MTLPLLRADDSVLLIVDMQTRLAAAMPPTSWQPVRDNTIMLARSAEMLNVPVLVTRQYPRGLGHTDPDIVNALPDAAQHVDKTHFAAMAEEVFSETLRMTGRSQVVVCGMETHVCVLQTVAGLDAAGYKPFTVRDATCSRTAANSLDGLARMRDAGIPVCNHESVMFEWLHDSGHPAFKPVSALLK